jgi:Flp pilus assembly protein TadG
MRRQRRNRRQRREGSILVLVAIAMVPLFGMVAFAVDYGYLLKVHGDLQRAADATALAAVLSLEPASDGEQDLAAVYATVRQYAAANAGEGFTVADVDIVVGRFEPSTIYSNLQIVQTGIYDTVQVTLRRDGALNPQAELFFAKVIGFSAAPVVATATAALQKAHGLKPGSDVLPFAVPVDEWEMEEAGDQWSIYGDGRILDESGGEVPGNWGTVDIGNGNNSTADLSDQIINGLRQADLDALYADGIIPTDTHIDAFTAMWLGADTGLSAGMKDDIAAIHGLRRIIPIYDELNDGSGNNLEAHIVRWGVITVVTSHFHGSKNTSVTIEKSYMYDGDLRAQGDLSEDLIVIEGAFTSPVLLD